jgi:tetratricopeptide (TPR) repeat protein
VLVREVLEVERLSAEEDEMTEYDWFNEAKAMEARGEDENALNAYESAIKINGSFAKAYFWKSKLLHKMGRTDEAIEYAKKTLEMEPKWEKHIQKFLPDLSA